MATSYAVRAFELWALRFKRTWRGTSTYALFMPLLYLVAMGTGVGALLTGDDRTALGGVPYLDFIAPGLLAATAMQTGSGEASWPVMGAVRWMRVYHAQVATPLAAGDAFRGHVLWMVARITMNCAAVLLVAAVLGVPRSLLTPLALGAAALTGAAFATPIAAWAVRQNGDTHFATLFRLGITPMFLFSGTFFPVDTLPAALRYVAYVTPLWHGTELCRTLVLGGAGPVRSLGHVAYLSLWAAAGLVVGQRTYARRLTA